MPKMSSTILLLTIVVLPIALLISPSQSCGTTTYWGQNNPTGPVEGTLQEACSTGNYNYIAIAFLTTFGSGQTPVLNLAYHCDPPSGTCTSLATEIAFCQSLGIKVLLSLGGAYGSYGLSSTADAQQVAAYLWTNYLSGFGGPLGPAKLDGIDFDIEYPLSTLYWDDLARAIAAYSTAERKIYLSTAPQCPRPDANLDVAINTGLFDYVWVQFYNNPGCDYRGGATRLIASWNAWNAALPEGSQLFLGLLASPTAAGGGYIEPEKLVTEILPVIRQSPNYGGIMLWGFDNNYSSSVNPAVCPATAAVGRKFEDLLVSSVLL